MTTLGQVASDQAEFEREAREKLLAKIEEHGLRTVANILGVDASNLAKMASGKRKLTPRRLVE
jgi:hypothetical protein